MEKRNFTHPLLASRSAQKCDEGKLQHDLVPPEWHNALAEVMTYGATKYAPNSWQGVEPNRYEAALMRHFCAFRQGEEKDTESDLNHLKHVAANALILLSITTKQTKNDI